MEWLEFLYIVDGSYIFWKLFYSLCFILVKFIVGVFLKVVIGEFLLGSVLDYFEMGLVGILGKEVIVVRMICLEYLLGDLV